MAVVKPIAKARTVATHAPATPSKHRTKTAIEIRLDEIDVDFYVRQSMDEERVLMFAELEQNGTGFPPIEVVKNERGRFTLIDGRTRKAARELRDQSTIMAYVNEELETFEDQVKEAFVANWGFSKPPEQQDIEHTLRLLTDRMPRARIIELFSPKPLPRSIVVKMLDQIASTEAKRRCAAALNAIAVDGLNVRQAAERYDVAESTLKSRLAKIRDKRTTTFGELKAAFSRRYRTLSSGNAMAFRKIDKLFKDGDLPREQVEALITHVRDLHDNLYSNLQDWEARLRNI